MDKKIRSPIPKGPIEFLENHQPPIPSGDYEVENGSSIKAPKPILAEHDNDLFPTEHKQDEKRYISQKLVDVWHKALSSRSIQAH
jgi:hypothetical protein